MRKVLSLVAAAAVAACGDGTGVAPVARVRVAVISRTISVGETVRATGKAFDADGAELPGRTIEWSTSDPAVAAVDDSGRVTGVAPGSATVTAATGGESEAVEFTVTLYPVGSVELSAEQRTLAPGEQLQLDAVVRDLDNTVVTDRPVDWLSSDPSVATVSAAGLVTAIAAGSARITARSEGRSDQALVTITSALARADCATAGPLALAVGEVRRLSPAQKATLCLGGGEYTLIPFHAATAGNLQIEVVAHGVVPASEGVVASRAPSSSALAAGAYRAAPEGTDAAARFEWALRAREARDLRTLVRPARSALTQRARRVRSPLLSLAVRENDRILLNAESEGPSCAEPPARRVGRVVAVTERAVVVADSTNPAGGFTDAEYRELGLMFDTLVYRVDVENFGEPTDIDENDRSIIFFTSAVNELTKPGSSSIVGGFFFGRDMFPREAIPSLGYEGCEGSNGAEMFYMLVPDPAGEINGNVRSKEVVRRSTVGVLAHEFQHLINFSRRLYVNGADPFEDVWLNEGLSHIAEELAFYRASGLAPRQNVGPEELRASPQALDATNAYQVSNLARLSFYLREPEASSPYAADDEFATRGAAWQLLRYAADRKGGDEVETWRSLVNSRATGADNLAIAFGADPLSLARDWAVAQYVDDAGIATDATTSQPSWNFRTVLPELSSNDGAFPLRTRPLADGAPAVVTLRGGGAAYLRFGVEPSATAEIAATSQGVALPGRVDVMVVRTQ